MLRRGEGGQNWRSRRKRAGINRVSPTSRDKIVARAHTRTHTARSRRGICNIARRALGGVRARASARKRQEISLSGAFPAGGIRALAPRVQRKPEINLPGLCAVSRARFPLSHKLKKQAARIFRDGSACVHAEVPPSGGVSASNREPAAFPPGCVSYFRAARV